jgi:hypothetical protein
MLLSHSAGYQSSYHCHTLFGTIKRRLVFNVAKVPNHVGHGGTIAATLKRAVVKAV